MRTLLSTLALLLAAGGTLAAGEFNPVLDIGKPAPSWDKLPAVDGKKYSLADFKSKQMLVVVFTCNSCPYAVDYEDRLIDFSKRVAGPDSQIGLVAINVNKVEEDLLPAMQARAKEKGFNFPYLFDESQDIGRKFGAGYTPEFFLLDQKRNVVYMGAMDNHTDPEQVTVRYLESAIEAVQAGKKPTKTETVPIGCRVRYERKRRTRPSSP